MNWAAAREGRKVPARRWPGLAGLGQSHVWCRGMLMPQTGTAWCPRGHCWRDTRFCQQSLGEMWCRGGVSTSFPPPPPPQGSRQCPARSPWADAGGRSQSETSAGRSRGWRGEPKRSCCELPAHFSLASGCFGLPRAAGQPRAPRPRSPPAPRLPAEVDGSRACSLRQPGCDSPGPARCSATPRAGICRAGFTHSSFPPRFSPAAQSGAQG